ncbi:MAG: class I SAM-dependent methyltransferase [Thermaurantiacus tibetensis]|uniref:class I SAM-dependent methyltransferase n=1 Tax=Thermaurantiacus tibetensis TaxID=2759035 RepID=UPI00188E7C0B|nr:class I SAM-dependent methyltransferase [Thermaurantiacus tibetensis]
MRLSTLAVAPSSDYALVDSGNGRKLERCGPFRFIRPEPQAMWPPASDDWQADGIFTGGSDETGGGRWSLSPSLPPRWPIVQAGIRLWATPTPFRHLGFFPDMAPHWEAVAAACGPGTRLLNLFGYSGVASLVAARAGAEVVHVDASRKAIAMARENALLSGLEAAPVRWIVEDARSFVAREIRRGRRYTAVLLDPPKYGRGPNGEVWSLETDLLPLLSACAQLLDGKGRLMIVTTYAVRLSALALARAVETATRPLGGAVAAGEMALAEEARGSLLPTAIFARWTA